MMTPLTLESVRSKTSFLWSSAGADSLKHRPETNPTPAAESSGNSDKSTGDAWKTSAEVLNRSVPLMDTSVLFTL